MNWLSDHADTIAVSVGISMAALVVTTASAIVAIVLIPPNLFSRTERRSNVSWVQITLNVVGWPILIAGVAMLILPGPGLVVVVLGLMLVSFPGRRKLIRWIMNRPAVLSNANRLRARFSRPPLELGKSDTAG